MAVRGQWMLGANDFAVYAFSDDVPAGQVCHAIEVLGWSRESAAAGLTAF